MNTVVDFPVFSSFESYAQLEFEYDASSGALFSWMRPHPRPCFNPALLDEITRSEQLLEDQQGWIAYDGKPQKVDAVVFGSRVQGTYNLGGDLQLFVETILAKNRELLKGYARQCVANIYRRTIGFGSGITTLSLIEGKAFGGGFESALATDIIVAERQATFSFPEMLFNMFPGMGALSLLGRRVGLLKAEEIITSGKVYTAKEMYDLGVVNEVVENGLGAETVRILLKQRQRKANTHRALALARRHYQSCTLTELTEIVDVWVEAAMRLETRDLRMMQRLVKAQDRMVSTNTDEEMVDQIYQSNQLAIGQA